MPQRDPWQRLRYTGRPSVPLHPDSRAALEKLRDKLDRGEYETESPACPVCHTRPDDFRQIAQQDRHGLAMSVGICPGCGLVQTNPRLTQDSYNQYYADDFPQIFRSPAGPDQQQMDRRTRRAGPVVRFLSAEAGVGDFRRLRVLDVGCADGGMLMKFREQGADVTGCDLSEDYAEFGRTRHGLDLRAGGLETVENEEPYDVVIYCHALEHILRPVEELNRIVSLLKPEGILYVEVPGLRRLYTSYNQDLLQYLMLAHVFHFSLRTLGNVAAKAGLGLVAGNEFIRSAFRRCESPPPIVNDAEGIATFLQQLEIDRCRLRHRIRRGVIRTASRAKRVLMGG